MLDIKRIKDDPEAVKAGLRAKEVDCDAQIDRILELDAKRRALILQSETSKAEQNRVSKEIPVRKKAGEDVAPIFKRMAELKAAIAEDAKELTDVEAEYRTLMLSLPNLPDPDLKPGGKENNEPLRYYGEPHHFDFEPKHHVDLCTDLGLIDYERGAKIGGNGVELDVSRACSQQCCSAIKKALYRESAFTTHKRNASPGCAPDFIACSVSRKAISALLNSSEENLRA